MASNAHVSQAYKHAGPKSACLYAMSKNKYQNFKKPFLVLNEKEKPFLVLIAKKRLWFLNCAGSYKKWVYVGTVEYALAQTR